MVSADMIKLIGILGGGLVIGIIGQVVILKKKKDRELKKQAGGDDNFGSQSDFSMSDDEKKAKEYIEQYKSSYPKESIKAGLINFGISDSDAENYINKYM